MEYRELSFTVLLPDVQWYWLVLAVVTIFSYVIGLCYVRVHKNDTDFNGDDNFAACVFILSPIWVSFWLVCRFLYVILTALDRALRA